MAASIEAMKTIKASNVYLVDGESAVKENECNCTKNGQCFVQELDRQFYSSIYLLIHDPIEFVKYHQELTTPNVKPSPRATKAQDLSPITDRY